MIRNFRVLLVDDEADFLQPMIYSLKAKGYLVKVVYNGADAVRIIKEDSWVLILPDASQPLIHLHAEGDSIEICDQIIDEYTLKIKKHKNSPG